ncbi:MAG: ATP-binding protein [Gammaproteobacteria bacterium]|jgi:predicted AAA+ superfamily ATPase
MLAAYQRHNQFKENLRKFEQLDPHLHALAQLKYKYQFNWWKQLDLDIPGIYILTGGRQVGKSTSCKQLIKKCLSKKIFAPKNIFYLPCDEIFDAKELSNTLRFFFNEINNERFLLIVDEITFVKNWDRTIKALADEGYFQQGLCILTGSDSLILKEAAMRFPGRRGKASQTDFHLYPLSFSEYTKLIAPEIKSNDKKLFKIFKNYLQCGGYLRAINDLAQTNEISTATFITYEQWIRGDFLKQGKNEDTLLAILNALLTIGVSQTSYSGLTQKIGMISKETCIDYCRLLERMDILINLQAYDQNRKQGFPRKARKFHFTDPFIYQTILNWLQREGYSNSPKIENILIEACVANHCKRLYKTFYFKSDHGEVDVIWLKNKLPQAIEVKWATQIRPSDLKTLKQFKNSIILTKTPVIGNINKIQSMPVYQFLLELDNHTPA